MISRTVAQWPSDGLSCVLQTDGLLGSRRHYETQSMGCFTPRSTISAFEVGPLRVPVFFGGIPLACGWCWSYRSVRAWLSLSILRSLSWEECHIINSFSVSYSAFIWKHKDTERVGLRGLNSLLQIKKWLAEKRSYLNAAEHLRSTKILLRGFIKLPLTQTRIYVHLCWLDVFEFCFGKTGIGAV